MHRLQKDSTFLICHLGCRKLTNFKQNNPIIAADNPFGNYFDASMVWGPMGEENFMSD